MSNAIEALVNAGIDVKLNKTDLIEMLVVEREESLDAEITQLDEQIAKLEGDLDKVMGKFVNARVASGKKLCKGLVNSLAKVFVLKNPKVKIRLGGSYDLPGMKDPRASSVASRSAGRCYKDHYNSKVSGLTNITVKVNSNGDYENVSAMLQPTKVTVAEQKLQDRLVDLCNQLGALESQASEVKRELANLTKMGKRAKAKLVKEFLSSTEQGEQLLKSMGQISRQKLLK